MAANKSINTDALRFAQRADLASRWPEYEGAAMEELYRARPFKTRNADEYDLDKILDLFVCPTQGLASPFEYENNILKGRMGSGKTMFLRANHAFYLYSIVPSLIDGVSPVLPVLIRLSDSQHLHSAPEIYRAIVLKIIEELASTYIRLQDVAHLVRIHHGIRRIQPDLLQAAKMSATMNQLLRLGADQYVERIQSHLGVDAEVRGGFLGLSARYSREKLVEVQAKSNPGIKDIEECYKTLLEDRGGKILLLIDEAGAVDRAFFRGDGNDSFFEILMNQLRTASYIRTKIAIYPNSYQDILTETRYGDVLFLEEVFEDPGGYSRIRRKALEIVDRYVASVDVGAFSSRDLFDLSPSGYGDALEQLIYGSGGNLRRLIQLFDLVMDVAFCEHHGEGKVTMQHAVDALARQSQGTEGFYNAGECEFLEAIAKACRNRSTYRFTFPYMSPILNKYTSRSQEYNVVRVVEPGAGRRGTVYAFDYAYCVAHDIPTHSVVGSERINKNRSLADGEWIARVATMSEDVLSETARGEKLEGVITFLRDQRGFITTKDGREFFFGANMLIEADKGKAINQGRSARFLPIQFDQNSFAFDVEVLD